MPVPHPQDAMRLMPVARSPHPEIVVAPDRRTVVGRSVTADVVVDEPTISRAHAAFVCRTGQWFITDLASTAGSRVNGHRLEAHMPAPISHGDVVRLGPAAFRVVLKDSDTVPSAVRTIDDGRAARAIDIAPPERRVAALAEALQKFSEAPSEAELAMMLVRVAAAETGFARAALLDAAPSAENTVQVLAAFDPKSSDGAGNLRVSTSLAGIARTGQPAGISSRRRESHGQSIAEMHVTDALCLPILLAGDVVAMLYLDTRDDEPSSRPHATDSAAALATAYALASANLKRLDLERRHNRLRSDLNAAREAQQLLFPAVSGAVGCARYALNLRPGDFIAGDLFDAIALPGGRAAFIVGDVTGHGLGPGLIMATAQATLRAALRADPDPERAMNHLNEDLSARLTAGRFVSLWLGILAPDGALSFVDAGHGHALVHTAHRGPSALPDTGDIPVGIDPDHRYSAGTMRIERDQAIVVYSDGVVEQRNGAGAEFGSEALRSALPAGSADPETIVRAIGEAVDAHAPGARDDDATIAAIARFLG